MQLKTNAEIAQTIFLIQIPIMLKQKAEDLSLMWLFVCMVSYAEIQERSEIPFLNDFKLDLYAIISPFLHYAQWGILKYLH